MTVSPSTSLHVQTPKLSDIKPSTVFPPSPLTPGSTASTMPSALNPNEIPNPLPAEEEDIIIISSPDMPHRDIEHEKTTPGEEEHAAADYSAVQANSTGSTALLGLQCAPPVILPPSPPLTVEDRRDAAEPEASMSAAASSSTQPQSVAVSPPTMQEEDITSWRVSMNGGEETRREVLEEEVEGELEGDYDPYDLGYSPVTPVSPSGLSGRRVSRTSDHPLRFNVSAPSPPPWEIIGPPENRVRGEELNKGFTVDRQSSRRPLIPHSSYYFGPPPLNSAYHTDPIGQIGLHHPREIIRLERDYSGGELVQFSSTYPLELEGRLTPTQFLETVNTINECLISAHSLQWSCFDNALSFFTLQVSRLFVSSHYDREMRRLQQIIDKINTSLYNPVGLNILWPRNVAFMFLEIEYY